MLHKSTELFRSESVGWFTVVKSEEYSNIIRPLREFLSQTYPVRHYEHYKHYQRQQQSFLFRGHLDRAELEPLHLPSLGLSVPGGDGKYLEDPPLLPGTDTYI